MSRTRVVQFIPNLGLGGAERMLLNLATGLDRERFDVKVLTFFDTTGTSVEQDIAASAVEVVSLGKRLGFDPRMFWRVGAALRRLRPDILHTHRPVFPYALPSSLGRLRGRIVHTVHSIADQEVEGRLRRSAHWLAYRSGVAPVAICDFVARSIARVYGVPPRATIPNGIPVRAFVRPAGSRAAWRSEHGVSSDAVVFVSVARLDAAKNIGGLLEAFAALGDHPEALLLLVGDGPLRAGLEGKARTLGTGDRVRFLGTRRDIPEVLAAADVFVLASLFEGHPLSVMEAMAAGRPIVATAVGGVPELVRPGETGLLVPPSDVAALSLALRQLLENPELRHRMGESAARTAAESFDVSRMVAAYQRLYEELLAGVEPSRVRHRSRSEPHRSEAVRAGPATEAASVSTPARAPQPPVRVVQFIPNLGLGGAERMLLNLATGLDRERFDVKVLTFFDTTGTSVEQDIAASAVEVVSLGKRLGFDPRMFWRVGAALRRLRPDILHTHRPVFPYALPSSLGRLRGRIVHTVHNIADQEVEGRLRRSAHWLAYRSGVAPVAICDFVARSIAEVYGVPPCATIPNGIPVAAFVRPAGSGASWRSQHGVPQDAVVFLSVGRLEPQKNTRGLLEAFAALGDHPEALLLLAGDGPLRAGLEEKARTLGTGDRVRFLGTRRDIPEVLAAADVFVLASLFEGHPLSVMEAMAAGRPVVATDVGGVPELVRHGETGLLVPPSDVAALSLALRQLLENPELRHRMGESAARTAAESFDVSRMVAAYERLYEEILADLAPRPTGAPRGPDASERRGMAHR